MPSGVELVTNGGFTSDLTGWTVSNGGWQWSNGRAERVTGSGVSSDLASGALLEGGKAHRIKFDYIDTGRGVHGDGLKYRVSANADGTGALQINSDYCVFGSYDFILSVPQNGYFGFWGYSDAGPYAIDNVSIQKLVQS